MLSYAQRWHGRGRVRRRRPERRRSDWPEELEDRRMLAGTTAEAIGIDDPLLEIPEGEVATITGTFTPATTAAIQVQVAWGDNQTSLFDVPGGSTQFAFSHDYPPDNQPSTVSQQFEPILTFSDDGEEILTTSVNVFVENASPVASNISIPLQAAEGQQINVSAAAFDPGGDPIFYTWNFGDQTGIVGGPIQTHTFVDSGTYTIAVTITDDDLGFTRQVRDIIINNQAPTANADTAAIFARASVPVEGNVLDNDTDIAGEADPLVVTAFDTEMDPEVDVIGAFGTLTWGADGAFSYLPDASNQDVQLLSEGNSLIEEFDYSISDGDGGLASSTLTITLVGAVLPLEIFDDDQTPNVIPENTVTGETVGITADTNVVAGATATFELSNDAGGRFQIDGDTGVVTVADGSRLDFESQAQYQISVVATVVGSGEVATNDFLIDLTDVNEPPNAQLDAGLATDEDTVLNIPGAPNGGLLLNDTDPDAEDVIAVTEFDMTSAQGAAVTVSPNGMLQYDPTVSAAIQALSPASTTVDSFNYTISDSVGLTSTATVLLEVTGVADAPVAADDTLVVFESSGPVSVTATLLTNDIDVDAGDVLSVVQVDTTDTVGTVTIDDGDVQYGPDGKFDQLNDGDMATDSFHYTVQDSHGLVATATVHVTIFGVGQPQNTPPTVSDIPNQTIEEDSSTGPIAFQVGDLQTATGDLVVTATSSDTTIVPNASIVLSGSGVDRTLTITPPPSVSGATVTITLTVSDGEFEVSDTFELTINEINDPPTITEIDDQVINEDSKTGALEFTIGDLETAPDDLIVTATSSDQVLIPEANITFAGSGTDRTVTIQPTANLHGTATITVTVSDGILSTSTSLEITVNPINNEVLLLAVERNEGRERFDQLTSLAFTFNRDVSASLDPNDLALVNLTTGQVIDLSPVIPVWQPDINTALWDFAEVDVAPGRYSVVLNAAGIQDLSGSPLDGNGDGTPGDDNRSELVVTLAGDTDLDLDVDFVDFIRLSAGFGSPGNWANGNFDNLQPVGFPDFLLLAQNFGKSLQPDPPAAGLTAAAANRGLIAAAVEEVSKEMEDLFGGP